MRNAKRAQPATAARREPKKRGRPPRQPSPPAAAPVAAAEEPAAKKPRIAREIIPANEWVKRIEAMQRMQSKERREFERKRAFEISVTDLRDDTITAIRNELGNGDNAFDTVNGRLGPCKSTLHAWENRTTLRPHTTTLRAALRAVGLDLRIGPIKGEGE